jgi:biotin carboxylase
MSSDWTAARSDPVRVAVVDGYSAGRHLVQRLVQRGVRLVHVRSRPRLAEYYERTFEPANYELDLGYQPDLAALAGRLRELGVVRVVAGTESGVILADALAHETGTPGNDASTALARRSKSAMAVALSAAGLDAPRGALVRSVAEARAWYDGSGLPDVVLKPVDSAGSDRVFFCGNGHEVGAAATEILQSDNLFGDANRTAVIQEALTGPEYYVNTVSVDGRHHIAETWRYRKQRTPGGMPVFDFEEPAELSAPSTADVHEYVATALDALGVRNGAAHSEVVLTARGPVLIDPGARLGGGVLPWVAEKLIGYSHAGLFAASIADPAELAATAACYPQPWPQPIRYVSLINRHPGTAAELDWREALSGLSSCIALSTAVSPGDWLPVTSTLLTSPGFVYLSADSQQAIEADYAQLRQWEQAGLYTTEPIRSETVPPVGRSSSLAR